VGRRAPAGLFPDGRLLTIVHGLPVGVAALIGALQPALTAMLAAWLLGEALSRGQWGGIALGFAGVALVISALGCSP